MVCISRLLFHVSSLYNISKGYTLQQEVCVIVDFGVVVAVSHNLDT